MDDLLCVDANPKLLACLLLELKPRGKSTTQSYRSAIYYVARMAGTSTEMRIDCRVGCRIHGDFLQIVSVGPDRKSECALHAHELPGYGLSAVLADLTRAWRSIALTYPLRHPAALRHARVPFPAPLPFPAAAARSGSFPP